MSSEFASPWYWLVLDVLAVWRATHCLHIEHGPWGVLARARALAARFGLQELFACFYCLSLWTAVPFAFVLAESWPRRIIAWLALSAGAVLLELVAIGPPPGASAVEDGRDDLLR